MPRRRNLVLPGESKAFSEDSLRPDFRLYNSTRYDMHFGKGLIGAREDRLNPNFKRKIGAAISSNLLQIGLDYAYRRYTSLEDYQPKAVEPRFDLTVERILDKVRPSIEADYTFPKPDDAEFRDWLGALTLTKALGALTCAHTLAHQGYLVESMTLSRLAVEKLALVVYAAVTPDFDDPFSVNTRQCLTVAAKRSPALGKLYGVLSKFAHWEPEVHIALMATQNDGTPGIWLTSPSHKAAALLAVALTYLSAIRSFHTQMKAFYPDRAIERSTELQAGVRTAIEGILERTRGTTSVPRLIEDLDRVWSDVSTEVA